MDSVECGVPLAPCVTDGYEIWLYPPGREPWQIDELGVHTTLDAADQAVRHLRMWFQLAVFDSVLKSLIPDSLDRARVLALPDVLAEYGIAASQCEVRAVPVGLTVLDRGWRLDGGHTRRSMRAGLQ